MSEGFDAAAAAARATGDSASTDGSSSELVAEDHADAEGAPEESDMGSTSRWREMLQSSDPDPPLSAVESPWDPEQGGPARLMRAVKKMAGMDGMPAWADIAIAIPETWTWLKEHHLDNVGEDSSEEPSGGDDGLPGELGVDR